MRIIGGHDYYDSAISFGIDSTIVFERGKRQTTESVVVPWMSVPRVYNVDYNREVYDPLVVYFADTVYKGILYHEYGKPKEYIWKPEKIKPELLLNRYYWHDDSNKFSLHRGNIEEYFTPQKLSDDAIQHMIDARIAIAILDTDGNYGRNIDKFHINTDGLKEIGFASVIDPWTAFQELSMWVGGVIPRSGNPTVEITDNKMKLEKAGFDNKVSFRHQFKG